MNSQDYAIQQYVEKKKREKRKKRIVILACVAVASIIIFTVSFITFFPPKDCPILGFMNTTMEYCNKITEEYCKSIGCYKIPWRDGKVACSCEV